MRKTRRFFFHYRKMDGRMSVHYKQQCFVVDDVECNVPVKTKRNNRQPRLVMAGDCEKIVFKNKIAIIN